MTHKSRIREFAKGLLFKSLGIGTGFLTTALLAATAAFHIVRPGLAIRASHLNDNFAIVAPEGAVIPFYLSDCPLGWAPADGTAGTPDMRGRFARGLNDFGTGDSGVDPDGLRTTGSIQMDAFQGHQHAFLHRTEQPSPHLPGVRSYAWYHSGVPVNTPDTVTSEALNNGQGEPRITSESRPVNVSLIYCMRKN